MQYNLLRKSGRKWHSALLPSNSGAGHSPVVLGTAGEQSCDLLMCPTPLSVAGLSQMIFWGLKHTDHVDSKCHELSVLDSGVNMF